MGEIARLIGCLPSMCEAIGLKVQDHPQTHNKFKASLDYLRPYLK